MTCIKCGKNTSDSQVFCDDCLSEMQKYPVKSDIPVQIPVRPSTEKRTASQKPPVRPEVQIRKLRLKIRRLTIALICAVMALALVVGLLFHTNNSSPPEDTIGKNYSTVDTDTHRP